MPFFRNSFPLFKDCNKNCELNFNFKSLSNFVFHQLCLGILVILYTKNIFSILHGIIKNNFSWCHQRAVKWWLYGRHEGSTSQNTWQLMTLICVRQQLRNVSSWLLLFMYQSLYDIGNRNLHSFKFSFILMPLFLTCFRSVGCQLTLKINFSSQLT